MTRLRPLSLTILLLAACGGGEAYRGTEPSIAVRGPHHLVAGVRNAGDLDGDGRDDLLVGADLRHRSEGDARVGSAWSGGTGRRLYDLVGEGDDLRGVSTIRAVGDVDGDGTADVVAACEGTVWLFSGSAGARLATLHGGPDCSTFGTAVAGIADLDGDGLEDLAVGDPDGCSGSGAVHLVSTAGGRELGILRGRLAGERFGAAVCGLGDVDGDGVPDLATGAPGSDDASTGAVRVHSLRDRVLLHEFGPHGFDDRRVGRELAATGDLDGDGVGDLVVHGTERLYLVAAADGALLSRGPLPTETLIGDWDGDGVPERVERVSVGGGRGADRGVYSRVRVSSTRTGAALVDLAFPHPLASFEALPDYDGDGIGDLFVDAGTVGLVYGSRDLR